MSEISKFSIKKGFDLKLAGAPTNEVEKVSASGHYILNAKQFRKVKHRLKVKEGDSVKAGSVIFENKLFTELKGSSPVAGTIKEFIRGDRRALDKIVIEKKADDAEAFKSYQAKEALKASADDILKTLYSTGYIALFKERPFSRIPVPESKPKSIFVNGMCTGPFQASTNAAVKGYEDEFQVGLNILTRLTEGNVNLCLNYQCFKGHHLSEALTNAENVKIHYFEGPHPSGNTSIHINRIDPINVGNVVWAIKGYDVVQIGKLFKTGKVPQTKIISLAGEGVKAECRKHYEVEIGADLSVLFKNSLVDGWNRIISGDVLSGQHIAGNGEGIYASIFDTSYTIIPESDHRAFLGWLSPGFQKLSKTRAFMSSLLGGKDGWSLNTNLNGSHRALVATGWYDEVLDMDIFVDVLLKAVMANDFDLAIKLGILETDPEDFGLCTFVCPSKTDVQGIIQQGLEQIELEGI